MTDDKVTNEAKPRQLKSKKQPPPDNRTMSEKEIDEAVERSKVKEARDRLRKKNFFRYTGITVFMLLSYGVYMLFTPLQGSMAFGICKTFLELNVRYPTTLYLSTVEDFAASVRIWYVQTDSFGEYRMSPIQCYYKPDPAGAVPYVLDKIEIERREVDTAKIEDFNKILPLLFANPPNLDLPWELPDSLTDLKVETDKYRKPILDKRY